MPFTLDDLQRITVRFGTGRKALAEMSDNQFTAWLRNIGAEGSMTIIQVGPGKFFTPLEDRVRILNELEAADFTIPGVTGSETTSAKTPHLDLERLRAFRAALQAAALEIETAQGLAQELGEIDPRVSLRQSLSGCLALLDAARGAAERAARTVDQAREE